MGRPVPAGAVRILHPAPGGPEIFGQSSNRSIRHE